MNELFPDGVPESPDPAAAPPLRWGVLGAGFIAGKFVNAVTRHTRSEVVAVGSRIRRKAAAFAHASGVEAACGSYTELVEHPEVEVVYVATPHAFHREHALLAIEAGKHVLVEKPLALSAREGQAIADAARTAGVFAMEAMWTRFLPHMAVLRELVRLGALGELVQVHADHGQRFPYDPTHRVYDPTLGGGALLDLGVYPVSFVHDLLGEPAHVAATGCLVPTGVDGNVSLALGFDGIRQATVGTTSSALTGITALVTGSDARVTFNGPFLRPTMLTVHRPDGSTWSYDGTVRNGFQYEVAEVARHVFDGRLESEVLPLDASVAVLRTLDEARRQLGVQYVGVDSPLSTENR